jgi:hypothetical protein
VNAPKGFWEQMAPYAKVVIRPLPFDTSGHPQQRGNAGSGSGDGGANGAAAAAAQSNGNAAASQHAQNASRSGGQRGTAQGGAASPVPTAQAAAAGLHSNARRAEQAVLAHCREARVGASERVLVLEQPSWAPEWLVKGEPVPPGVHLACAHTCCMVCCEQAFVRKAEQGA